jgi:integrase
MNDITTLETEILPADRNPAAVYLASLSAGSVPSRRSKLGKIAGLAGFDVETMPWHKLEYQHVAWIRARLAEQYSARTANDMMYALKAVLREAWRLGYIGAEQWMKIDDIDPIKTDNDDLDVTGRALTPAEISRLMIACASDRSIAGVRDAAVIALGYGLGMRRSEITRLQMKDYDRENGTITVHGKGHKTRILPVDNGALDALSDWLAIRGDEPGKVFWGINKGGNLSSHSLSLRAVHELLEKRAAQAGLDDVTFHDLRRSFITHLLDRGNDVALVAKLAGHSSPTTTLRYDRRRMERRRQAIGSLHVPYQRR